MLINILDDLLKGVLTGGLAREEMVSDDNKVLSGARESHVKSLCLS
jgi:hypothetical protein